MPHPEASGTGTKVLTGRRSHIPALRWLGVACLGGFLALSCGAQPKSGLREPEQQIDPVEGARQGRALVADLLAQMPAENTTNSGVLIVRAGDEDPREVPVRFAVVLQGTNWISLYETAATQARPGARLTVIHTAGLPNVYWLSDLTGSASPAPRQLGGNQTMVPFGGSDFWACDLGLEFLHWPQQRLIRKEMRRSQSCDVVESVNPQPARGSYARVKCWIGIETGGIIHAEAYDAQGNLMKVFDPKGVKKVNGQWQLEGMEIRNRQTGSRTKIEFQIEIPSKSPGRG